MSLPPTSSLSVARFSTPFKESKKSPKNKVIEDIKLNTLKQLRNIPGERSKMEYLRNEMEKLGINPTKALRHLYDIGDWSEGNNPIAQMFNAWDAYEAPIACNCNRGRPFSSEECMTQCRSQCPIWLKDVLENPPMFETISYGVHLKGMPENEMKMFYGAILGVTVVYQNENRDLHWKWNAKQRVYVNDDNKEIVYKIISPSDLAKILCLNSEHPRIQLEVNFGEEVPHGFRDNVEYVHTPHILYEEKGDKPYEYWLGGRGTSESETWMARSLNDKNWLMFEESLWWIK